MKSKAPGATPPTNSRVYLSPPHMSQHERQLVLEAFDSNWIAPLGPQVDAFEREFAAKVGAAHAVALSSGTAALHLALLVLGIRPGDEVITSTLTFVATANAIRYAGGVPVFIDSEPQTWNMDPQLLAEELQARAKEGRPAKAVLAVDILGQCADYAAIEELCRRYDTPLIEDAAEALGATLNGRAAGTFGEIGCFSFNGNKIVTTSGGGMLVTERQEWADHVRHLATQARQPAAHYEHAELGYNYRLSNLLAAIGRGQLSRLDELVQRRRSNFAAYQRSLSDLPGVAFMPQPEHSRSNRWLSCITIDEDQFGASRDEILKALADQDIESRPLWKPMHLQPLYAGFQVRGGAFAESLFRRGLCLPSGSNLAPADLQRIVQTIRCQCVALPSGSAANC